MKKPNPSKKMSGMGKTVKEYGGGEVYKNAMKKAMHEGKESKKKEMTEGKTMRPKSSAKMTSDSTSMPKSKSGMGLKNTIKKVAKKATEMVTGKPKRKAVSLYSKGKAFM